MSVSVVISGFDEAAAELQKLELEMQSKAMASGMRAAANVVKREAKRRIPSGIQTGNSEKKSKATQNDTRLRDWIKTKVKHYDTATVAIVGADYQRAPHGHLYESGHQQVLWGRPTGARVRGKGEFAAAVDTTKQDQETAIVKAVVKLVKKHGGT